MTVMLSSQGMGMGIGLITVIAVSGCSFMLLVFGRQKLLELRKDYAEDAKQDLEDGRGSLCRDSLNAFSVTKQGGSISWRINLDISESHDCCLKTKTPNSALGITKVLLSQDTKRNLVKKVRFSEDVVEPSGNSADYRRRHAMRSRQGRRRSRSDPECRMPPNRMALYSGMFHDRSHRSLLHSTPK